MARATTAEAGVTRTCPHLRVPGIESDGRPEEIGEEMVTAAGGAPAGEASAAALAPSAVPPPPAAGAAPIEPGESAGAEGRDAPTCTAGPGPYLPGPRQRALVCESTRFPSCPRFPAAERRALDRVERASDAAAAWATSGQVESRVARRPAVPRVPLPTAIAGGILVLALVAASAFAALRGGIDLAAAPGWAASPSAASAAATASPSSRVTPGTTAARPSPAPTVSPAPGSPAAPTPVPATPAPTPVVTPAARPVDPRYAGLRPCPDRRDCYLYVVRRGDTLSSIAAFFGVSVRAVRDLNREIENPSVIRVGQRIRVPGPG